jgi:hypothetical protein
VKRSFYFVAAAAFSAAAFSAAVAACTAGGAPVTPDPDARASDAPPASPEGGVASAISRWVFVHGAPGLPEVRLCFRVDNQYVFPEAWPWTGSLPAASYPGLAPGAGALVMDSINLAGAAAVEVAVHSAYGVATLGQSVCRNLEGRSPEATIGPMSISATQGVVLLRPCRTGAGGADSGTDGGADGGTDAGSECGDGGTGYTLEMHATQLAPSTDTTKWVLQPMLLTDKLAVNGKLALSIGATPLSSDLSAHVGSVSVDRPSSADFATLPLVLKDSSAEIGRWTLAEALALSDPRLVPSDVLGANPVVVAVVGDPMGSGGLALHPLLLPFDVTR